MSDEKLLGDLTEEALQLLRADRVARAYTRITKKPCNCGQRKEQLNELHRKWREFQTRNQAKRNEEPSLDGDTNK